MYCKCSKLSCQPIFDVLDLRNICCLLIKLWTIKILNINLVLRELYYGQYLTVQNQFISIRRVIVVWNVVLQQLYKRDGVFLESEIDGRGVRSLKNGWSLIRFLVYAGIIRSWSVLSAAVMCLNTNINSRIDKKNK